MAERVDPKLVEPSGEHSPGAYLRQAREAADMSIGHVAAALHLKREMIEALEADAFDRLPASTFVRGYLHGYARVLGLPPEPVLEMYNRHGFEPPPLATEVMETKQAHTSDPPVRLVTYAVGAVLVLLVGLWWRSQGDAGFDLGDDLLGWWSDATAGLSFPGAEAPATAPAGDEAGRGSSATAPDRIGEPSRRDEPPASPPAEGPATAGFPPDTPAPDGSGAGGRTVAMAPDRAGGQPQGDEPPASSPAGGPATADIPPDAPAPDGSGAGGRTVAMAPDRAGGPTQGAEPPAFPPAEGPATADVPPDAPAPDGSGAGGRTVAMVPDRAGGQPQGGELPASPPAEGPATADVPSDAPAPDGSGAGGRTVAMVPDRAGGQPQGGEPPATSPAEGPAIAGTGPAPAEGAGPGAMTERGDSAAPEPRPEVAAEADPAAVADPGDAGRPQAPAPRETHHADATDGPDATAVSVVTPPSIPETSPPGTDSAPPDVAAAAPPVAETAQPGLVLAFVHESWVEVYDRERVRLFFGNVQPGGVLDFDGPQPFDVLLGYGEDVRVVIDGEAFDHTPYLNHGVARFSVGTAPAGGADAAESSDTVAADAGDSQEAPSRPRDGDAH